MTEITEKQAVTSPKPDSDNRQFQPFRWFFNKEVIGSVLLLIASAAAVYAANSFLSKEYDHFLHTYITLGLGKNHFSMSLLHWINDGLMAIFFFTVGLEIKREIMVGELASLKMALLPVIAAVGGMLVPGLIFTLFNYGTPYMDGWGIPVATDIAFSLGAIALFGRKLPVGLRIFLAAFAIADDLGAVVIIALFYTNEIVMGYLIASGIFILTLLIGNLLWIRWIPFYIILGIATWIAVMGSGVHATVAGVAVALLVPAKGRYNTAQFIDKVNRIISDFKYREHLSDYWYAILLEPKHLNAIHALEKACHHVETPLQRLEHALHPWVVFLILPLFAFGNAGLTLTNLSPGAAFSNTLTLGITIGLLVGKPVGVTLFAWLAVKMNFADIPEGVAWRHIMGAAMLGGIGFTMSLFIAGLSFTDPALLNFSKLGVLTGSILSGIGGILFLSLGERLHQRRAGG